MVGMLATLTMCYLGFGVFLYAMQRSMLYFPTPEVSHQYPVEEVDTDETIKVITVNERHPRGVIYFGGNGEAVAFSAPEFEAFLPDATTYLVNYRGYGGSTGRPMETSFYRDALAVFDQVASRHNRIVVIGRSLGSSVATFLATKRRVDALVLVTPFDSVVSVAQSRFPIYPAKLILKDQFDSTLRASELDVPTLVLVAEHDRVIPRKHTDRFVSLLADPEVHVLPETDHNDISHHEDYYRLMVKLVME